MQTGRICRACKEPKPDEAFRKKDSICRVCNAARCKEWRRNNYDKFLAMKRKARAKARRNPVTVQDDKLRSALHGFLNKPDAGSKYQDVFGVASSVELYAHLMLTALERYGYWLECEFYEIDHIKPRKLAHTEQEMRDLYHYSNLQFLTPEDNHAKWRGMV